jgi:hypothetical protein
MSQGIRLAVVGAGLALLAPLLWAPLNHDVAGVMHFARRMLAGERLYEDLADVNPPLAFLLALPPVWLADLLGLSPRLTWAGAVGAAWAWAVFATARLLRGRAEAGAVVLGAALLLGSGAAGMLGQREHLFLLLATPWMAARAAGGPAVGGLAVAAALLAGLGAALKPLFLAVLLALEALALLREGPRRWAAMPGPWPLLAGPLSHAAMTVLVFPAYLSDAVPWLLGPYQSVRHLSPAQMAGIAPWGLWASAALAAAGGLRAPRRALPWAAAGLVALGGVLLQGKGWSYHWLPPLLLLAMAGAAAAPRPALAALCVLPLLSLQERVSWPPLEMAAPYRAVAEALAAERGPVVVLSPLVFPFHPALLEGRVDDRTPAMSGWPAQAALACPGAPADPALAGWFRARLAERLRAGVSALYIDTALLRACPGSPTFGAWLRADPVLGPLVAGFAPLERHWRIEVWRPALTALPGPP